MMSFLSRFFFLSGVALIFSATILHSAPPANDASTQQAKSVPSGLAPMKYFAQNCERCHGPHGEFYGKEFGKNLTDAKLRQFVHDMAEGPGGVPLKGEPLEALVAYHRSLIQKMPFVVITQWKENVLSGEATPEAQISVCWPGENGKTRTEIKATRAGDNWSVKLPDGVDLKTTQVTAHIDEARTVISLTDEYSHRAALDAAKPEKLSSEKTS